MLRLPLLPAVAAFALMLTSPAMAQGCEDTADGADHPGFQRYDGSCLVGYAQIGFDAIAMPAGPLERPDGTWQATDSLAVEGRTTRLLYVAPFGRSVLEVFRNYETSLGERGYRTIFSCTGDRCGGRAGTLGRSVIYPAERRLTNNRVAQGAMASSGLKNDSYLLVESEDGGTVAGIYFAENDLSVVFRSKDEAVRTIIHLDVVERQEMDARMIDAAAMAQSVGESGRVTVDNIFFDFGQASLQPESAAAIAEMAKLLTDNPEIDVFIVGHTDYVGNQSDNLDLSRRRAEAVMNVLTATHGIAAERIVPAGVGALSPVASNRSDAGRTQNRRVELVER